MKQPPDGLSASTSRSLALFSPSASIPGIASGSGAAHGYHKASLRRLSQPLAFEGGLELSAGLKSLDFPANTQLYTDALDAAIELLHADGGVLATLDPTGQRLVVRHWRGTGVLEANYTALAALGHPPSPSGASDASLQGQMAPEMEQTRPLQALPPGTGAAVSVPEQMAFAGAAESSAPAGMNPTAHTSPEAPGTPSAEYACGQGVLGHIWKLNRALILSAEQRQALPRDATTPPDLEMAWSIGAPIRVPEPLLPLPGAEPAPVVGVLVVAFRDEHWSPPKRYLEVLQMHADRVALALQAAWLEETRHRQASFLRLLHDASLHFSTTLDQEHLFAQLHQLVLAVLGDASFAILLYHQDKEEVEFAYGGEKASPTRRRIIKEKHLPRWWKTIKDGAIFTVATPEERQEHAKLLHTGWLTGESFASMLILPLLTRTREHIIGALSVASQEPRSYTREQIEILETIAHTAAFALENADLYNRSSRSLEQAKSGKRQVAALNNAVSTLNASLDVDETLKNLVKQANLLTTAQICTVFFFDEDEKTLVARASNAREEHLHAWSISTLEEMRFELPAEIIGRLRAGERILLDHLEEERTSPTLIGEQYRRYDVHAALLLPILRQESLLGVLVVYTPGQRHLFLPEEMALLEGLAGQAAVALHNARLYMDLQQALEQQKELDRLKDDFIVTASHEFRTPLSAIHGYASLLQRHSARLTIEQARRFSTEITRAAQQLVGMVTTLMDASRLDSRKLTLSLQPVEVRPLAESALALIQPDIQQPIRVDIPAGLWVSADQERLRQVMTNLLINAGKYSPSSSPIDFLARVECQFTPPDVVPTGKQAQPADYLIVSVVDRGEGIAPDDQKKLFQKFVRLQRSLTTPVRGTGLGLYICRQYLTAMGGSIWVESAPGLGSTFSFALPLAAPPAETKSAGTLGK